MIFKCPYCARYGPPGTCLGCGAPNAPEPTKTGLPYVPPVERLYVTTQQITHEFRCTYQPLMAVPADRYRYEDDDDE